MSGQTIDELAGRILSRLAEDEYFAREASGGTVVGERGNWRQAPGGDEWEAVLSKDGDEELLVALRPGLPRPPDAMSGYWGAVVSTREDERDRGERSPMPEYRHMARHDPARVLADVARQRAILARLLAEPHHVDRDDDPHYTCPLLIWPHIPCDCGRDERVLGYLRLLAGVDEAEAAG